VALSDWLHPPDFLACDFGNWRGQAGDIISVQAVGDVLVASRQVAFRDDDAAELLVGEPTPVNETWREFEYPTLLTGAQN